MKPLLVRSRTHTRPRVLLVSLARPRRVESHKQLRVENIAPRLRIGMVLLLASIGGPFTTLADQPAPVPQPLVIEFEYLGGIRQEIEVAEGTAFEVTTSAHGNHLKAAGRIGRVHDGQVELVLSLNEWRNEENATGRKMHYENLPIGKFQSPGGVWGAPYLDVLWVRRGDDPAPALLANIRRLDRNSILAASYVTKMRGDAGGLVPELVRVAQGRDDVGRKASPLNDVEWQQLRTACTAALGHVGQGSPEAALALQTMLAGDNDDALRIAAAVALWKIAKHHDAPTFLVGRLRACDGRVRFKALAALAVIGAEAPSTGPLIVPLLNDPRPITRAEAAWALWRITRDPRAVDTLIAALKNDDIYAVEKLGMIGYPDARRAAPLLADMVLSSSRPEHVATALTRVDPDARRSLPLIAQAVSRNEGRGAEGASIALASYGSKLIPGLDDLLQEGDEHARRLAFYTLWRIGPAAVDTLAQALQDDDPETRRAAAGWLRSFLEDAAPAVPNLVKALNDDVEAVREEAAFALEDIGAPAVRALQHELKQGNERTRQRAERILEQIKAIAEMDNDP